MANFVAPPGAGPGRYVVTTDVVDSGSAQGGFLL